MGVIRVEHNENYTTMSNYHLRDNRLSLRAIGLMSKMLSLPDDWDYTVSGLASIVKEGRDAVRKTLQELEAAGYLIREQGRSSGGNFAANDYTLFEEPKRSPLTEIPSTVNPLTGSPTSEISAELNNVINQETNKPNHTPLPPKGESAMRSKAESVGKTDVSLPKWKPERFEAFYNAYPKHEKRLAACRAWDKLRPDAELLHRMAVALRNQMRSAEWQENGGQYIPQPSSWLNGRRWEDEADTVETYDPPERKLVGERC